MTHRFPLPAHPVLYLLALALLVLAGCGKQARLQPLAADAVVLAFGDSLTYGTGADERDSYPAQLALLVGRKVARAGVPGEISSDGLARLPAVVDEHNPRLVILCLGGNDMLRQVRDAEIAQNLRSIIKTLRDRKIAVVLIGVPKPALITSAPVFYADLAKEFAIPYEGKVVTSVLYSNETKSDPIQPNARGYRRIAEAIAQLLKNAGAI